MRKSRYSDSQKDWISGFCRDYLRNFNRYEWNHKHIDRTCCDLGLNLRIRSRKRIQHEKPVPLVVPDEANDVWSTDFMRDQLSDGRSFHSAKKRGKRYSDRVVTTLTVIRIR